MYSLHLTHPSAHTPGAVGSRRCDARGAVGATGTIIHKWKKHKITVNLPQSGAHLVEFQWSWEQRGISPELHGRILSMISRQLGPQSQRKQLVTHYAVKDWNPAAPARSPCSRRHMYRPVWNLPMIQRTGWKCCGQMRPQSSSLASTQLSVFGGGGMLPMTPRSPSPPSNMNVETLCFGGVFLPRGQDTCTASKGRWAGHVPLGPGRWNQPGHWKWVVDGYSSMKMTQNTQPRQQRSGSRRSTLRSWSGIASLQTLIP